MSSYPTWDMKGQVGGCELFSKTEQLLNVFKLSFVYFLPIAIIDYIFVLFTSI